LSASVFLGVNGEGLMNQVRGWQSIKDSEPEGGFTLMELLVGIGIAMTLTVVSLPMLQSSMGYFRLRGAISSITGAVQSTRYQAIVQGIPYQIVFDSAAKTYQIQNQPGGAGAFANVCVPAAASCPVPLSGGNASVTLDVDTTLTFSPGGRVSSANNAAMTMKVTYTGRPTTTIKVSSYGNINVTP
jgi:Tfp pilus assembly protein FimT